jgi:hypothetical protein
MNADCLPELVITAENGCPIALVSNHAEYKHNAQLIVAAPEMLEALDIVVGSLLWNKQDEASIEVMRRVNAVRAKAEGRS